MIKENREWGNDLKGHRCGRSLYEKPFIQRVDLALEETLSSGCKLSSDTVCVGPPITAFSGGS